MRLGIPTPRETYILLSESMDTKDVTEVYLEQLIVQKERKGEILYPAFLKPLKVV
jgi:hypothetical protein